LTSLYPPTEDLEGIVQKTVEAVEVVALRTAGIERDARIGLATFPAEQVVAMSLSKQGLDADRE
jgi:hypothetical protein